MKNKFLSVKKLAEKDHPYFSRNLLDYAQKGDTMGRSKLVKLLVIVSLAALGLHFNIPGTREIMSGLVINCIWDWFRKN